VARRIDLLEDGLHVLYTGLSAVAVVARGLTVPYSSIGDVRVGLRDLPGTFAIRLGLNTAPFGHTRRGTFWAGGRRVFLDLDDPERTVVLELEKHRYARVALGVDDPEALAEQIRDRVASAIPPRP
jgi:hypothetical protein